MKILVTGGKGQLGLSINKVSDGYPDHTFVFAGSDELDITDNRALRDFIEGGSFDGIINCAAYTCVDKAEDEKEKAWLVNNEAPRNIAALCAAFGIKLVHLSTDYVYPGDVLKPLTENGPVEPLNVYGKSKLSGEQAIMESGAIAAIVRTQWLYSEFGRNFALTMLRLSESGQQIKVVNDQFGAPTYAPELADVLIALIERDWHGCEIYNYSSSGEASWYDFAVAIFKSANRNAEVIPISTAEYSAKAVRPKYALLDCTKIKTELDIEPPLWNASIDKFVMEWKKKQN